MIKTYAAQLVYNGPKPTNDVLKAGLGLAMAFLGAISLIVMVLAGLKLAASRGNPDAINKMRNTIIYSSIGLVVAVSAELIIQFVVGRL